MPIDTVRFHLAFSPPEEATRRPKPSGSPEDRYSCRSTLIFGIGGPAQLSKCCPASCPSPAGKAEPLWAMLVLVAESITCHRLPCMSARASFTWEASSHHFLDGIVSSVIIFHRKLPELYLLFKPATVERGHFSLCFKPTGG